MSQINDITSQLAEWLRNESFTPPLRAVSPVELTPPALYPYAVILVDEEAFGPADGDVTAALRLRVAHAAGRPADAQFTVRELAHQLRTALGRSHGLGGGVLRLRCGAIRYGLQRPAAQAGEGAQLLPAGDGVVHYAEIALTAKYHTETL